MGVEKRREGIRGENNERESRLNETRAIVRVHFFFFHYNFQPVFLFEKREYGFLTLAWAAFVVVPPCELVSSFRVQRKVGKRHKRGHEGHKKETNGRKIITTRSLYKRFLFLPSPRKQLARYQFLFQIYSFFLRSIIHSSSMNLSILSID